MVSKLDHLGQTCSSRTRWWRQPGWSGRGQYDHSAELGASGRWLHLEYLMDIRLAKLMWLLLILRLLILWWFSCYYMTAATTAIQLLFLLLLVRNQLLQVLLPLMIQLLCDCCYYSTTTFQLLCLLILLMTEYLQMLLLLLMFSRYNWQFSCYRHLDWRRPLTPWCAHPYRRHPCRTELDHHWTQLYRWGHGRRTTFKYL